MPAHSRSALRLLESGWRACDADNALGWLLEFERLSWALLEHYRAAERTDRAAELVAQWQQCMAGQDTLSQSVRIGATEQRLRAEAGASAAQVRSRRQELEALVAISARHATR